MPGKRYMKARRQYKGLGLRERAVTSGSEVILPRKAGHTPLSRRIYSGFSGARGKISEDPIDGRKKAQKTQKGVQEFLRQRVMEIPQAF